MRNILRALLVVIGTAGLWGASTCNAESPQGSSETQGISGNADTGARSGDNGSVTEAKQNPGEVKPAGEIEKAGLKRTDTVTPDDGPSNKPGYHEWIQRGTDCEKKEQLEREFREKMERQHR